MEVIKHHGILGMRWGVRRKRGEDGLVTDRAKAKSPERMSAETLRRTPVATMTNAQLKSYVDRMNLEIQYNQIKSREISTGRKFVQDILKEVGKEVAKEALKAGIHNIKKKLGGSATDAMDKAYRKAMGG